MLQRMEMLIDCSTMIKLLENKSNDKTQDTKCPKLDKYFIDNWITFLFYTHFLNDTGFYIFIFIVFQHYSIRCQWGGTKEMETLRTRMKKTKWSLNQGSCITLFAFFPFKHRCNLSAHKQDKKIKNNAHNENEIHLIWYRKGKKGAGV